MFSWWKIIPKSARANDLKQSFVYGFKEQHIQRTSEGLEWIEQVDKL